MSTITVRRLRMQMQKSKAEHDEWVKEMKMLHAEGEKLRIKAKAEYKKDMKELHMIFGRLGISLGDQVEAMFVNLWEKFKKLGYSFDKDVNNAKFVDLNSGMVIAEIDRLLENGDVVMLVEIKAKLKQDDVDSHIKRLGIVSVFLKQRNDSRKIHGAVAGGIVPENVRIYTQSKGLYVLVQNGKSVSVAALPDNFAPRDW